MLQIVSSGSIIGNVVTGIKKGISQQQDQRRFQTAAGHIDRMLDHMTGPEVNQGLDDKNRHIDR